MRVPVCAATGLAWLLAIVVIQTESSAQPAAKAVRAKKLTPKAKAEAINAEPADATKPSNRDPAIAKAEAAEEQKQREAEQAKLDFVAGALRDLFGGGGAQAPQFIAIEQPQADIDAQFDAMTQQFVQQLHPILKSELGFVRLICSDLTPEQRAKIRKPAEAALKDAAKQLAKHQNQMQRGMAMRNNPTEGSKQIREAIHKAMKDTLTEPQYARYEEEATLKIATRKQTAISNLISRLDGQLYLTVDQRERISDSLTSKWQDGWEKWLAMMNMYGDRYFPTIPDQCVTPFLNTEQKLVWQSVQKVDFGAWWGGGGAMENLDDDGWWGDEPAKNAVLLNGRAVFERLMIGF